jgi:hypothetical protein
MPAASTESEDREREQMKVLPPTPDSLSVIAMWKCREFHVHRSLITQDTLTLHHVAIAFSTTPFRLLGPREGRP